MLFCDLSLITMHISDCCQFSDIRISQGSVATYLRCGEIFKYEFVANLPVSLPVKEFWKSVNIWESYGQELCLVFLRHSVENKSSVPYICWQCGTARIRLLHTALLCSSKSASPTSRACGPMQKQTHRQSDAGQMHKPRFAWHARCRHCL